MKSTFHHAKRYLEMGLSVIPLKPRDKPPNLSEWKQYQTRRATEEEIDSWFKGTDNNIGIVCGKVSGDLVVVDFDDERAFRYCFSQGDGLAEKTLCARTSKGLHVYLRLEETTKKTTLRAIGGTDKAKPSLPVDIQGEGGYVVAPPSIHPTGKRYGFINEVNEIALIDSEQWTRFNGQMRERAEEWPIVERLLPAWNEGSRQNLAMGASGFFRKIAGFNEDRVVRIIEGICQATGDTEVGQRTSAVHATFSKDVDDVAIVNWLGEDLFSILKKVVPAGIKEITTEREVSQLLSALTEMTETQAQTLLRLAQGAGFIITPTDDTFAMIERKGHREILPLRSKAFRKWLSLLFYDEQDKPPGSQAVEDALKMLEALAEPNAIKAEVHVRLAHHDGAIYLDLGSADWRVVEIDQDGWRIVSDPPVFFWRPKGQRAIPEPVAGGSLDELRHLVNLPNEDEWILAVAWIVGAYHPEGPYPILCPIGEAGSAKSCLLKLIKNLIDPTSVELRTVPREERDLMIAAHHNWMIAFDNLSGIHSWLSDAICRLATGGGFGTRQLYQDQEEIQFWAKRPVALNGIGDFVTRGDMADRCIFLRPPPIGKEDRKEEAELLRDFRKIQPRLLGALLDAVSMALARRNEVVLPTLPRMADFAKWVVAAEPALPWPEGAFLAAYMQERERATETLLEADTVASAIRQLMERTLEWSGTATELLDILGGYVTERVSKSKQWPDTAQMLGLRLSYAGPSLRAVGIEVDRRHSGGRIISIRKGTQKAVQAVLPVQEESGNEALARQKRDLEDLDILDTQAVQAVQELSKKGTDEPDAATKADSDGLDNLDNEMHTLSKKRLEQEDRRLLKEKIQTICRMQENRCTLKEMEDEVGHEVVAYCQKVGILRILGGGQQ
jgi:hypothetical protein